MQDSRILSLILLLTLLGTAFATHFRFGTISYRIPDSTKPNVVTFFSSFTFRRTFFSPNPNVGSTINPGTFSFGDGSAAAQLYLLISAIDTTNDWAAGTFTVNHTYPVGAKNYTAMHTSAGRILALNNNPNLNWNVTCTVSIGQYVTNANGALVPNTAPVSNNLPIVSVFSNEINTFRITAQDPEGTNLTYSLGSALDMGGTTLTLVPNLNVSADGIVTFDTRNVNTGYWCTQIKFSDGLSYAVVDFLIYSSPRPRVCSAFCTNKAVSCTTDSQCTGCTGGNTGQCIVTSSPSFVPPTPTDGTSFTVAVGNPITFQWSAYTPNIANITVTSSSLPAGSVLTTQTNPGNFMNQTLTWTPSLSAVGVYVVTLGCYDSGGQSCPGQVSFSISVPRPYCGYGTISPPGCDPASKTCTCSCQAGFDPAQYCYDCLDGYYGSSCTPCPPCENGVCIEGFVGTGGCVCNSGWQGAYCNFTLGTPCNLTVNNYILSTSSVGTYVNPSTTTTVITTNSAKAALAVPFVTTTSVPSKLDILLLVDVTKSITSTMLNNLLAPYSKTFFSNVRAITTNSYFGVASFTDQPSGTGCSASDYPFRLHSPLSGDQSDFESGITSYYKPTVLGCDDNLSKNDSQLDALYGATSSSVGWRNDAFRVVILVTDSPFWEGAGYASGSVYASRTDVYNALIANNIIPLILPTSAALANYTALITSFKNIGLATVVSNDFSNVYTVAVNQLPNLFKAFSTIVVQDSYGFVTATSNKQTLTLPQNVSSSVSLKFPQAYLNTISTYPVITVTMMGWGSASIIAQINRKPAPSVVSITTREDIPVEVPVASYDPDGNAMFIVVETLPTLGTLYINKSTNLLVVKGTTYNLPDGGANSPFNYVPKLNVYGNDFFQYYVSDGCARSSSLNASVTVTFFDYPPVANSVNTNATENVAQTFTLSGSDIETPAAQLVYVILSLPDPTLGVLKRVASGANVVLNDVFAAGENTIRFVPVTYACCDNAQFTYQTKDSAGQMSNIATYSIYINPVNQVPVASASNIQVDRGVKTAIALSVFDPDANDKETFSVTKYTAGSGSTFATAANVAFTTAPVFLGNFTVNSAGAASTLVYYTASSVAQGSNFANFTFTVTDSQRAVSTPVTVVVSINPVNRAPTANPAGPIPVFQDSLSAYFNLNGTDPDPADANSLQVQIVVLPTKGTLVQQGGSNITTVPFTLTNPNVAYRTAATGEDTFSFRVVDNLGSPSALQVVKIIITAVNHSPTVLLSTISTNEDVPVTAQVSTYDQDGDVPTVYVNSIPKGTLTQFDGTPITTVGTALTDSQYRFKFQGLQYDSGTPYTTISLYADDRTGKPNSRSATITVTINVIEVNYPPVPTAFSFTLNENDPPVQFTLPGTDIETPSAQLTGFLTTLPPSSLGVIQDLSGNAIAIRQVIPAPRTLRFVPAQYQKGTTSFSFGVNDGSLDSTSVATATITINHVNHAPSASVSTPVIVTRTVSKSIPITISEFDIGDQITLALTSVSVGGGSLTYGSTTITSAYTLPGTFTIPNSGSVTITLNYVAPATASGSNYASFTFVATDNGTPALSTAATTVTVNIAQNNIPTANPAGPISVVQDSTSQPLTLSGTDADVADANSLVIVIQSIPTKGTLRQGTTGTAITQVGTTVPSGTVTYSTTQRAGDQFTFAVRDNLGAVSASKTVTTVVTPVNHAPSAYFVGTAAANEDTTLVITNIQATDPDAGDVVTIVINQAPTGGSLLQYDNSPCNAYPCTVTDSQYRMQFVPNLHAWGTPIATLNFSAYDGAAYSAPTYGALTINFVDYPPVASSTTAQLLENDPATQITLSYSDFDSAASVITAQILSLPAAAYGTLTTTSGATINVGDVIPNPLTVVFTPALYKPGSTSFTFKVKDALSYSNVATLTINVQHVNHAPTALWVGTASTNEDTTLTITNIQVNDPDVGDSLSVSVTVGPSTGTLQQSDGTAITTFPTRITDPQYKLKYVPPLHAWGNPLATITLVASDGALTSAPVNGPLHINFVNYPPVSSASTVTIQENAAPTTITFSFTDFDSPASAISTTILSLPSAAVGRLTTTAGATINVGDTISGTSVLFNTVQYAPGSTSFSFKVKDELSYSASNTVSVTVQHVNHAPTAVWVGTASANEDQTVIINNIRATDPDTTSSGDIVTVKIVSGPTAGTLTQFDDSACVIPCTITDSQLRMKLVPALHAWGNPYATFTFQASDGTLTSSVVTGTVSVNFVDYPPVAANSAVTTTEDDTSVTFSLSYTDFDSAASAISTTIVSLPSSTYGRITTTSGTAINVGDTISGFTLKFWPVQYYPGSTSFTFKLKDAVSYSNTATVSVTISHVNHAPSAFWAGQAIADEDTTLTISNIQMSDPDRTDTLTAAVMSGPAAGTGTLKQYMGPAITTFPTLVTDSQGRLQFTPIANANGIPYTSIQVAAWDGSVYSTPVTGQLNINPVNDAPVASASTVTPNERTSSAVTYHTITLGVTDIDNDASQLTATIQSLPSASIGALYTLGGTPLTVGSIITPNAQANNALQVNLLLVQYVNGGTTFQFSGSDGQLTSSTVTVTVNIQAIRQVPVCGASPSTNIVVPFPSNTAVQFTVFDPDPSETYTFTMKSLTQSGGGSLKNSANQVLTASSVIQSGVTTSNYNGDTTVTYVVSSSESSASMTVTFVVNDGTSDSSICTVTFQSNSNHPPVATPVSPLNSQEEHLSGTITLTGTDQDGGALLTMIATLPQHGTLYRSSDNVAITQAQTFLPAGETNVYYISHNLYRGPDSFKFTIQDPPGAFATLETVSITVTPFNHAPTIVTGGDVTTLEDTAITITGVFPSDPDGDVVNVFINARPSHGDVYQVGSNTPISTFPAQVTSASYDFVYVPPANANSASGAYTSFAVYSEDSSNAQSSIATANIFVTPVDDAPIAGSTSVTVNENASPSTITIPYTDIDTLPAGIRVTILSLPTSSIATLTTSNGPVAVGDEIATPFQVTLNPASYGHGSTSFSFNVKDQTSYSANVGVVSITVTHINHAPTAIWAGVASADENGVLTINEIQVTDHDVGDTFVVDITQGPVLGTLKQFDGVTVCNAPCRVVDSQFRMKYYPVQYGYGNPNPYATIQFQATDNGGLPSNVATGELNINFVDQPPVAAPSTVNLNEDAPATSVVLSYTDVDTLPAAMSTIIVSLPSATYGKLTTTSGGAVAVGDVIPSTSLLFTPVPLKFGSASFSFKVQDAIQASNTEVVTLNIAHVNHAPTAVWAGTATADENTVLTITQIQVNDPDVGDVLTVTITQGPTTEGTLTQFDGTACTVPCTVTDSQYRMKFTPTQYAHGTPLVTLKFKATDNHNGVSATVDGALNINFVNQAPVAVASTVALNENAPATSFTFSFTDVDNTAQEISVQVVSLPPASLGVVKVGSTAVAVGDVIAHPHTATFTPASYSYGTGTLSFSVQDSYGASSASSAAVTFNVAHVNHAPTASWTGTATADEDTNLVINNIQVTDPDVGDVLTVTITQGPAAGTLKQFDGTACTIPCQVSDSQFRMLFVPVANGNGVPYATIQFEASDGHTPSATITGTLNINPVDDPPVANAVTVNLQENQDATVTFLYSDIDSQPNTIYATVLSLPPVSLGALYDTSSGSNVAVAIGDNVPSLTLLFVPAPYTFGTGSFSFQVHDATSYSNNVAQVTLVVAHVNHAPTASGLSLVAVRGVPLSIVLAGADPDSGDTFTFALDSINSNGGTFQSGANTLTSASANIATGVQNTNLHTFSTIVTYTAPVTASGTNFASFTFHVVDQGSLSSSQQTVTIDMTPNSIPIATPDDIEAVQDEVSPAMIITGTDADVADATTLTCVITTKPTKGTLIINGNTNLTSVPTTVAQGSSITYYTTARGGDSFSFYVQDNLGAQSSVVTIPITITPTNHGPTAEYHGPVTTLQNQNLTVSAISTNDQDGDTVTVYITVLPTFGSFFQADGITPITNVPTAITDPQNLFVYVPPYGQYGSTTFSFYADDGQGKPNSQTANITGTIGITHVDGAPIAVSGMTIADENTANLNITLGVIDDDTPESNLSIYITTLPDASIGALYDANGYSIQPYVPTNKVVYFVLVPFASGNTSFSFMAYDGELSSANVAVHNISITHINMIPSITYVPEVNLERSVPTTISVYAFDGDTPEDFDFIVNSYSAPSGGDFFYNGVNLKTHGNNFPIVLASNVPKTSAGNKFSFNFTAAANQFGNALAHITLSVKDSYGAYSPDATIALNVLAGSRPVADPAGPITFVEEGVSSTVTLSGTDTDPADAGHLAVIITTLPTKAVLVQKGANGAADRNITAVGTVLTNPVVYLIGDKLEYGTDSFYFQVMDKINETSVPQKVDVTITHINHPPTAGFAINNGLMNKPLGFNVFGQDPDNEVPTVYITALPAVGTLHQGDGSPITAASPSAPVKVTDFNGYLTYVPPTNTWGAPIASVSIYVDDGSGASNSQSPILTQAITINQVNLPPLAQNVTASMPQGGQLTLKLNASDPQGYPLTYTILTFPSQGVLYQSDNVTVIDANSPNTGADGVIIYVPPAKDFDSATGPYASLTYWATANSTLVSNTGFVSISVYRTHAPPVFTGATSYSIADNTNLTMLLSAYSETGSYSIILTSSLNSTQGLLYVRLMCMGDEACEVQYVDATNTPYTMNDPGMENRLRYTPPADKYGDNFAVFSLVVWDAYGQSAPVTITINIYHVNVPPVIVPYIYKSEGASSNWSNAIININEGKDVSIMWKLSDKDTPQANLTSFLYALPYRGHLYTCVPDGAGSCTAGEIITQAGTVVNNSADHIFRVVYRPAPASSGQNYATFSISGYDGIDKSARISLKINVKHNNLPPTVNIADPSWNASTANPIIITGVSVNDSDASFYSEMFRLTLTDTDGNEPASGLLSLVGVDAASNCDQETNFTINCTYPLAKLNVMLQQISVEVNTPGRYLLTVFADDLGAGADVAERATTHLNDTGYVQINVTNNMNGGDVGKPGGSSVMTAVVASAAGAGVAAAFGAWRYMKKKMPPTDAFFGSDGMDSAVTDNPLYEDNDKFMSFSNALYEGQ